MKCTAVGIIGSLTVLLLRRYHPELSFLLSTAAVTAILLSSAAVITGIRDNLQSIEQMLGSSAELLQPLIKCLGISAASRIGAGLCRDSSQTALASAVETVGVLCAVLVAMPTILTMIQTIGGIL